MALANKEFKSCISTPKSYKSNKIRETIYLISLVSLASWTRHVNIDFSDFNLAQNV